MRYPLLVVKQDCGEAVQRLTGRLTQSGFQVVQTFDLHTTRFDHDLCSCPHHGTEQCDCQMVVLLVYHNGFPPASVIAHGHAGNTWFTLADSQPQRTAIDIEAAIGDALAPPLFPFDLEGRTDVS